MSIRQYNSQCLAGIGTTVDRHKKLNPLQHHENSVHNRFFEEKHCLVLCMLVAAPLAYHVTGLCSKYNKPMT